MLAFQFRVCILLNVDRNATDAKAFGRTQGLVHPRVRKHIFGMLHLVQDAIGGITRIGDMDTLHVIDTGMIQKFFFLLFPLCLLFYVKIKKSKAEKDKENALTGIEDVQHMIETRLKNCANMRDHHFVLRRMEYGWWIQKYWTGTEWVAFLLRALIVFGRDGNLIDDPVVLELVMSTIRALYKAYCMTKSKKKTYDKAFLQEVAEAVERTLSGMAQMQAILEKGGRSEVNKYTWGNGADAPKSHAFSRLMGLLYDKGDVENSSGSAPEATNTEAKAVAKASDGRRSTVLKPSAILAKLFARQVNHCKNVYEQNTKEDNQDMWVAGKNRGIKPVLDTACLHHNMPFSNQSEFLAVLEDLGSTDGKVSACMLMLQHKDDNGNLLTRTQLRTGECALRRDGQNGALTLVRLVAVIQRAETDDVLKVMVQVLKTIGGGAQTTRHSAMKLPQYALNKTDRLVAIPAAELLRMENVSHVGESNGEGTYVHSRGGPWHIGAGHELKPATHPIAKAPNSIKLEK
jgi:hypothetical protein